MSRQIASSAVSILDGALRVQGQVLWMVALAVLGKYPISVDFRAHCPTCFIQQGALSVERR